MNYKFSGKYVGLLVAMGAACAPALALAAGPTLDDVLTNSGITEAGHISASYTGGFNKGQVLAYRAFDGDANTFELNQAAITLSKQPTEGFGGLVTLTAGSDAKIINNSYGSGHGDFAVTQGFLQYATGKWTFIGGRYVTLAGAEYIDDSQDANVSRSLLFTLAEPLVHTGVRAAYAVTGTTTAYLGLANSALAGAAEDSDKTKTAEAGLSYTSIDKKVGLSGVDYYGVDAGVKDNFLDVLASYQLTDKLSLTGNGDYFRAVGHGANTYVAGAAVYLGYQFTEVWKGTLRGEYLTTRSAVTCPKTGGKCDLEEVTATVGYTPVKSFTILGELRYDISGDKIYPNPGADTTGFTDFSKDQGNVGIKAIYSFGNASG